MHCACRRFYGILNYLGLYNKNAKILFLVSINARGWSQMALLVPHKNFSDAVGRPSPMLSDCS
jgi:hypothetical protein